MLRTVNALNPELAQQFHKVFGHAPTLEVFAPGRVNLIGEHTDYNDGLVLPTPIAKRCTMQLRVRNDQAVRVHSQQKNETLAYTLGAETQTRTWLDYIAATTQTLAQHNLCGFDVLVTSDVPLGSGLSSSAALLVCTLRALRQAFGLGFDDLELARLAQHSENSSIVGAHVGLLDQMACSVARPGDALFVDFRTMQHRFVPLPQNAEFIILHSGLTHSLAHDDGTRNYKTRRAECEHACKLLGVSSLRDLGIHDLHQLESLPQPFAARAKHVITENNRVERAVVALEQNDLATLGALFYASHDSQSQDYDCSEPFIDLIVRIAQNTPGILGARLTGGGFGGSVVMLCERGQGQTLGQTVANQYAKESGQTPQLLASA